MKTKMMSLISGLLFVTVSAGILLSFPANASASNRYAKFKTNGELMRPEGYREWIFIGAPLTPNDMNNGKAAFPEFHNVYIDPNSWKYWKSHGKFRDGTIIVKELVSVATKSSSSGNGYFMGEFIGLEAVVKDKKRFPDSDNNWGFFRFTTKDHKKRLKVSRVMKAESCVACHKANADQDLIFIQHYPVLRAEK